MKKAIAARRCSQALSLGAFIYILWSTTYPLKGPLPPGTFFKFDPLIMVVTSVSERVILLRGLLASGAMLFLTLILGRFFCGWVCPLGTTVDMVAAVKKRHPSTSDPVNAALRRIKFYIFGLIILVSFLGLQVAWVLDPIVIMARFISLNFIPFSTSVVNGIFIILIKYLHLGSPLHDFYRILKASILGVKPYYFAQSGVILFVFLLVCAVSYAVRRSWCRALCPLGALYALCARFALLRRVVAGCTACGKCKSECRMGAIKDDLGYVRGECILCMDCIYDCPESATRFTWLAPQKRAQETSARGRKEGGISRKNFLVLLFSSLALAGFRKAPSSAHAARANPADLIRPPAALKEEDFVNRCIRCGNCMKVCITNGLQPVMFQSGLEGIWTPQLVPEIGYCEYRCTLCGTTCPTGAIPRLTVEKKQKVRLGIAEIDRALCIPWAQGQECIVCEEHCPVFQKAITLTREPVGNRSVLKPYIDETLCIGCGICQNKCPVRPVRAVRVFPRNSDRT